MGSRRLAGALVVGAIAASAGGVARAQAPASAAAKPLSGAASAVDLAALRRRAGRPWLLEWNAYVCNGRTPGPVDPTDAKMVGGRFAASTTRPHPMTFGASFLLGEYSDQAHNFDIVTEEASRPERIAYVEQGGALDASVDLGRLRMTGEEAARYWLDQRIRSGTRAPRQITDAALAARLVSRLKGAVAYVPIDVVNDSVRVVARIRGGKVLPP